MLFCTVGYFMLQFAANGLTLCNNLCTRGYFVIYLIAPEATLSSLLCSCTQRATLYNTLKPKGLFIVAYIVLHIVFCHVLCYACVHVYLKCLFCAKVFTAIYATIYASLYGGVSACARLQRSQHGFCASHCGAPVPARNPLFPSGKENPFGHCGFIQAPGRKLLQWEAWRGPRAALGSHRHS